jgi:hypothetical protein
MTSRFSAPRALRLAARAAPSASALSLALALAGPTAHGAPPGSTPPGSTPPASTTAPATAEGASGKGLRVTSADGDFSMNLRGRIQLRAQLNAPPPAGPGADREPTLIGRVNTARIFMTGHTLSPDVQYVVQLAVAPNDYRDGTVSPVYDAYLDLRHNPNASVRVGQIFVPFDRARTIREFALQLPDRQRVVSELSLDRDLGAYLYSDSLGGASSIVAYRLGVFAGGGPNAVLAKAPGMLSVARLELRPLGPMDDDQEGDLSRSPEPRLALGAAAAYNLNTNRARSTTSTTYTAQTADYTHLAADLVFKWRGAALLGEVLSRSAAEEELVGVDAEGAEVRAWARSGAGWFVQPSVLVFKDLELAGRYGELRARAGTDPTFIDEAEALGKEASAGVNWYENGHRFKIQAGWAGRWGADFGAADHTASVLCDVMF